MRVNQRWQIDEMARDRSSRVDTVEGHGNNQHRLRHPVVTVKLLHEARLRVVSVTYPRFHTTYYYDGVYSFHWGALPHDVERSAS